jgi:hypothetical protein
LCAWEEGVRKAVLGGHVSALEAFRFPSVVTQCFFQQEIVIDDFNYPGSLRLVSAQAFLFKSMLKPLYADQPNAIVVQVVIYPVSASLPFVIRSMRRCRHPFVFCSSDTVRA